MSVLIDILGEALGEWLLGGGLGDSPVFPSDRERGYLVLNGVLGAFALALVVGLTSHSLLSPLVGWSPASFGGLAFATLTAACSFAYTLVHLVRRKPDRLPAMLCLSTSALAIGVAMWLSRL